MTSHPNTPPGTPDAAGVARELAEIWHRIANLVQTMWAARRGDELMDTVAEAESLKSVVDALVLDVVGELDATHAVKPVGWASTQDFLTAVTGGHKNTGPAMVRLAKAGPGRARRPPGPRDVVQVRRRRWVPVRWPWGSRGRCPDEGHPLVTPAIWRALVIRDKHCRFPNCTRPPVMTHAHRIVH